ncbi:MAG: discoidin domain-containing protein [Planctomycetota bacterium]
MKTHLCFLKPLAVALAFVATAVPGPCLTAAQEPPAWPAQLEQDWLRQAEARPAPGQSRPATTREDAAGACDGIKNGKYGFHTAQEPNPWWQVDLGGPLPLGKVVVYNRLDYAPGLHNADNLLLLTSDDGKAWTERYDNKGKHFGGVSGAKPLEVAFGAGEVRARFVRLQIRSAAPIFFHLDEVEVYGPDDATGAGKMPAPQNEAGKMPALQNLALHKPADQSSTSQWSTVKAPAPAAGESYPTAGVLERGRRLAADLQRLGVDTRDRQSALDELAGRLLALPGAGGTPALQRALYLEARARVRQLAFSNPLLNFAKLIFVKRFTQETYPDVCLNHMPWVSRPGGDICILARLAPDAEVEPLLNGALGPGHVHGMDLWWDADRVVFGYAKAKNSQPPPGWLDRRTSYQLRRTEEPTHIFEVRIASVSPATVGSAGVSPALAGGTPAVRQLSSGEWSDLDPTYLPSGEVAFVSERCGYSLQCNEFDKDETSCNLYIMQPDGGNVRRLSVTKDGDYLPHTLDDGTIGYTRWEYQERGWANIQSVWTVRPDGTGADAIFKQHFNDPWAIEDARSIPGSRKLLAIATGHHTLAAGPVVLIDPTAGINNPAGIGIVTPGVRPPEGGMSGVPVPEGGVPDAGGFYMTPWPLSEKYFLVSYNYGAQSDPVGYGLYLIDVFGNKELLYRDPAISCFMPMPLRPRPKPPVIAGTADQEKQLATCALTDVSRGVEGVKRETIRYLRIGQGIAWPYDNQHGGQRYEEKGKPNSWTPVRVLGTVPIEADGSAHFVVPADTPVYFQLLDENRMELRRMRSFISFQPGEVRGCVGCHESRNSAPAFGAGTLALSRPPSVPAPAPWGNLPVSFLRDVQPILDKHCMQCHTGLKPAGGLDFSGGLTRDHNAAFDTIISRGLVAYSNPDDDAKITLPLAFGSHKSKLVAQFTKRLNRQPPEVTLDEFLRVVTWVDANAPYHDRFVDKRPEKQPYDLVGDTALLHALKETHAKRCATCHKADEVTRPAWIDLRRPEQSLFLAAPLAKEAGGSGRCKEITYKDQSDPDYRAVREAVEAAVKRAWENPRRDVKALVEAR